MLVVAAVATTLGRLELGEFLFPVTQDMRFDVAQLADLANGEVALTRDFRELGDLVLFSGPPRFPLSDAVSGRAGRLQTVSRQT